MIFCSKCKIAFDDKDIIKYVKKKDGIYFYHAKCYRGKAPLIKGKDALDIPSGISIFFHGHVKKIIPKGRR